ncbi:hypothetical protein DCAR_0417940 [Daucus carota subsp. sativus]|uniref:Reverse transcriptase Ty1/copia-type domain-containing protein n=1 Tax=Daucus carota subsp. sativus TaxID=79200 RepID=A0AAF1AZR9_DAUCS|nr:hypothetical protein DCAR_0417940 [Daucus carota subsp. sativus]
MANHGESSQTAFNSHDSHSNSQNTARKGHAAEQCFKLVGYPDWYQNFKAKPQQSRIAANVNINDQPGILGSNPQANSYTADTSQVDNKMVSAFVSQVGTVMLTPSITLQHVLYVPEFKHNLLSVGKLLDQNNLIAKFDQDKCFFQDHKSQIIQASSQDYSLFTKMTGKSFTAIVVYVDDLLVTGNDLDAINSIKTLLHQKFTIKDLGDLKYFLGVEVLRTSDGIHLNQRKYILDLLAAAHLSDCNSADFPLSKGLHLSTNDVPKLPDPEKYRRIIGKLLYLNLTRPDISYAVQQLSQFLQAPAQPHYEAALHVLRYLKGTLNVGLFYKADCPLHLTAYSDADWGTCSFSAKSLSGYAVFLGSSLISWKTKKQKTVSKSSAESEYRSMSYTTSELIWIEGLLQDLHSVSLAVNSVSQFSILFVYKHQLHELISTVLHFILPNTQLLIIFQSECLEIRNFRYTLSVPINSIQFPWDVPSILYIPKIAIFYNIKHYYTHYILPLSPFYNNKNTITPTTFLHYLKSIIKKYMSPTNLPTFHLTLLISYTFSWSPCPIPMYITHWDGGSM